MTKAIALPKTLMALLLALCTASVLMLAGCGGSDDSESSSSSSTSSSSTSSSSAVDEEEEVMVEEEEAVESTIDADIVDAALAQLSDFYAGETEAGEYVYYAGGQDGQTAILVYWDKSSNEYVSFIGPLTDLGGGQATVEDETTGMSMTFTVTDNGDGTLSLSMGSELGNATVSAVSASDLSAAIVSIAENATPMA